MWKDISGYDGYEVSDEGEVRKLLTGKRHKEPTYKAIKPVVNKKTGYFNVKLYKDGKQKTYPMHRLVADTFIENSDGLPYVVHVNHDRGNNAVDNLRWSSNRLFKKAGSIYEDEDNKRWQFKITLNGNKYQKWYKTLKEAEDVQKEFQKMIDRNLA